MLEQYAATLQIASDAADAGSVHVMVMPWGKTITHNGRSVTFDRGSLAVPNDLVPVNVDHDGGSVARIGKLTEFADTDAGLEAVLKLSDTALGRDVLTLLRDGVIEEVSAGVMPTGEHRDDAGTWHKQGDLDHVAIVGAAAFGEDGSRVLEVHHKGADTVTDTPATEPTPEAENHSAELDAEVLELRKSITELAESVRGVQVKEPNPLEAFTLDQFIKARIAGEHRGGSRLHIEGVTDHMIEAVQKYALADDTTTTGAGVVPDFQSSEIISIVDANRPFHQSIPSDPIGSAGMTVDYPIVATKPSVAVQSTQKTEVDSTAMDINTLAVALATYAGASDVAIQLIERSSPSFVQQLFREYAHVYATTTEAAGIAAALAGAGDTAVLADLGADADATRAAFLAANTAIITGVRKPADTVWVGATRWEQLLNLVDTTKRPLMTFPDSQSVNADGQVNASAMTAKYLGMTVILVPDSVATTCVIANAARSVAVLEQSPQQLRALQVDLLGWNMGIYAYWALAVKYAAGLSSLTPS